MFCLMNFLKPKGYGPQVIQLIHTDGFDMARHLHASFQWRHTTPPGTISFILNRLGRASKLPRQTCTAAGLAGPIPVIRLHRRHGRASLHRLVCLPLDHGGDLGERVDVDVIVHTRQLEVVVGGVGRVVGDVEGLAADGVEHVCVCDPDGRPRRRALDGAGAIAQLDDVLGGGRCEW